MKVYFSEVAINEFKRLAQENKKIALRITQLVEDITRNPVSGIGKPERLKHELTGHWSRRIDKKHRLIYRIIDEDTVEVVHCYNHYNDR